MPQSEMPNSNAKRQAAFRRRRSQALAALQAAKGLPPLPAIATIPGWPRWRQLLAQMEQAARDMHEQMQSYHDERTDEWQESDKAEDFSEKMNAIEALLDHVVECRELIQ